MNFDVEADPRLRAVLAEIDRDEREQAADAQAKQAIPNQLRQTNAALQDLNLKIVLGKATEQEASRVRARRDELERELPAIVQRMAERQERIDGRKGVLDQFRAELRTDRRKRAFAALRPLADRRTELLLELAEVNHAIESIEVASDGATNIIGAPCSRVEFRNDPNEIAGRCIQEAKTFAWDDYRA